MTTKVVQLDIFGEHKEQQDFKKNVTKSIRGLFVRYNEVEFVALELAKRLEKLEETVFRNG